MARKIRRSDCNGCHNEFYHCGGATGNTKKCWSFDSAELSMGRIQHKDTIPQNYKGHWKLIPDCYRYQSGFVERRERGK